MKNIIKIEEEEGKVSIQSEWGKGDGRELEGLDLLVKALNLMICLVEKKGLIPDKEGYVLQMLSKIQKHHSTK